MPEEDCRAAVEQGIHEMIGGRPGPPQFPFQPEGGGNQRNIVHIFRAEPDVIEGRMDDVAIEDEGVIVPEKAAAEDDGGEGGEGKGHEQAAP